MLCKSQPGFYARKFYELELAKLYAPLLSLGWEAYAIVFVLAAIKPVCDVFAKK